MSATTWKWKDIDPGQFPEQGTGLLVRILNLRLGQLSGAFTSVLSYLQTIRTFPAGSSTPSVAGAAIFKTNNPVPTNITGFSDGKPGIEVLVWSTDANTTFVNSASLRMKGGANVTMTATETRRFATVDGSNWREV